MTLPLLATAALVLLALASGVGAWRLTRARRGAERMHEEALRWNATGEALEVDG